MSNPKHKLSRTKRWVLIGALIFFAFQLTLPALVVPHQVYAIAFPNITIEDIPRKLSDVIKVAKETLKNVLKKAGDVAFKNVLTQFLNNLAYNAATQIATGDWGQKPLFPTQPGELLKQAADVAAGDFLDDLVNTWAQTGTCNGFSSESCGRDSDCKESVLICPGDMVMNIPEGITAANRLQTYCSESKKNYDNCIAAGCTIVQLSSESDIFGAGKNVPEGSFSALGYPHCISGGVSLCDEYLGGDVLRLKLNIMAREAVFDEKPPEISGKCPLSEIIDNYEKGTLFGTTEWAPNLTSRQKSQLYLAEISKTFNPKATDVGAYLTVVSGAKEQSAIGKEKTEFAQGLAGAFSAVTSPITGFIKTPAPLVGNILEQMVGSSLAQKMVYTGSPLADALGVFTNTLASKLMTRFLEKGLVDDSGAGASSSFGGIGGLFGGSRPGVTAAKTMFADLKQADYSVGGEVDILSKLASCPDKNDSTPDNCVIDDRFRTAIQQRMTVREALDDGLLDGTRIFGFDANGREPEYYNGYPYRSLVILRKYRVIPVGWELAAKYLRDYASGNYGLNVLIQEYNNPSSPFYRLVDPNWVLKAPDVYCKRQGAGEKTYDERAARGEDTNNDGKVDLSDAAANIVQRQDDYCADEQMCLKENEDGSCKQYGYCVEEQPLWKFDGTSCSSHYNTCQTFTGSGGEASYLKNTVDYDGCNAGNAGCQWYCQDWSTVTNQWVCVNEAPPNGGEKMSFNRNAAECSEEAEGCNEFISIKNSGANLLKNSGFEDYDTTAVAAIGTDGIRDSGDPASSSPDDFTSWNSEFVDAANNPQYLRRLATNDSFEGLTAARLHFYGAVDDNWWTTQSIDTGALTDNRTFTLSFHAKRASDATDTGCTGDGDLISFNLKRWPGGVEDQGEIGNVHVGKTWTRYVVSATFGLVDPNIWNNELEKRQLEVFIRHTLQGQDCDIIIDNVQLEEGGLTSYKAYEDSPKNYLRKAPDYYNCYDSDLANDSAACGEYALSCPSDDVGCEAYTSKTTGSVVTGSISNPNICDPYNPASCDQCPAEFVGCQAYRELSIEHAPRRPARDPVSFVADTGISCPASAVGCEEYTNLEEVAAGGEGKEYYSWIKQCVNTDDANLNTYYTWEGSDEFGYQLKKYSLKESNLDAGPCTNMGAENDPLLGANDWPTCIDDYDIEPDGVIDYPAAFCDAADVGINPDCAEFYDTAGITYYRIKSRVIYASEDCKTYRNTIDGPGANYHLIPGQGKACSAAHAGCRAYKGNAGDNIRIIYEEDFEGGTVDPWIGDAIYSNESTYVGGHSMLVSNSAAVGNAGDVLGFQADRSYTVSFWAKGAMVDSPVSFGFNTAPALTFPGQAIVRAGEWGRYEIGPLYIPVGADLSVNQLLTFGSNAFYVDNIVITEIFENIYLIKDSYTECPGYENCDQYTDRVGNTHYLKSFSRLCGEDKVGCEAMIDTQNTASSDETVYSDTRLRGDVNGDGNINDDDMIYLSNHVMSGGPPPYPLDAGDVDNSGGGLDISDLTFLVNYLYTAGPAPTPSNVTLVYTTIPADEVITLVNDPMKSCASTNKGCERLGLPIINVDGNVSSFTDYYLKNNPDEYNDILCAYDRNDCEEYTTPGGSRHYFKDPGNKVCEFKRVTGQEAAGWYLLGTGHGAPDCPVSIGLCLGGYKEGEVCNSSDDCGTDSDCVRNDNIPTQPIDGWVGMCPASDSGCTEYRDPEQPMIDSGSISDVNLAINGSFEQEPLYAGNLADWYTDGEYDQNTVPGGLGYVPDELIGWRQLQTTAGSCTSNTDRTCNSDSDCGVCNADITIYCGYDKICDVANPGDTCNTVFDTCNIIGNRVPCGNRLAAMTDEELDPMGASPTDGEKAVLIRSYDYCSKTEGGDAALYTWHGIDTGYLTDNRAFKVSFDAKRAPAAIDADCAGGAGISDIFFQLERTIDDRRPGGYADYLTQHTITATDTWGNYEHTFYFGSAQRDWVATTTTLDQLQRMANVVFRRSAEDVNPAAPDNPVCDLLIDNVKVEEVTTTNFLNYTPYYYINDTVDQSTCNGIVSREEGCRLFEDTSNADLPYSSTDSEDGAPPALCEADTVYCDSNMVLKVISDRECKRWLECETTVWSESDEGKTEELCTSRYLCNKMDEETGFCTSADDYENVNQTFASPAFADQIKHYSGMVLAGLDWGRRCSNNPNVACVSDNDCLGGTCSDPQIVQGYLQYPSMEQAGTISTGGELVRYGDFGDSNYKMNQALSCRLSGGCPGCGEIDAALALDPCDSLDATPPTELDIGDPDLDDYMSSWGPREFNNLTPNISITEENINNGSIPSTNANLDENNVVKVITSGNLSGISYDLGSDVLFGEQYAVSFKMRWSESPLVYDKIRVELEYIDNNDVVLGHQSLAADITPSEKWREYSLGPITAGNVNGLTEVLYRSVRLNIIHNFDPAGGNVPLITFYLDDVSMKPVLTVRHGVCESSKAGYPDNGKQCKSIGDCVRPGFDDGAVACVEQKNIAPSCRLYPGDDAPYCDYIDENSVIHQGWQGYCIEHDPNNSKYCINWWPVDLLLGESDAFSALPSFMYKGERPVYMCLASEGNYESTTGGVTDNSDYLVTTDGRICDCDNTHDCDGTIWPKSPMAGQPLGNRRFMQTILHNNANCGGDDDDCDKCGPCEDNPFMRGGSFHGIVGMAQDSPIGGWTSLVNKFSVNANPADKYYKWEIEKVAVIAQCVSHNSNVANGHWHPGEGGLAYYPDMTAMPFGSTTDGPAYMVFYPDEAEEHGPSLVLNDDNDWEGKWCWSWEPNPTQYDTPMTWNLNCLEFDIHFDANDQIESFSAYANDWKNGGSFGAAVVFYLREQCTDIVEVVSADLDEEPWAWNRRITAYSGYDVPDLGYIYTQNDQPFGSAVVPDGSPSDWGWEVGSPVDDEKDGPLYITDNTSTRAGSSYSCSAPGVPGAPGDCTGRMCSVFVKGRNYTTQNLCIDQNDVEDCHFAGGYCIGLGSGFCSQDATMYCDEDGDCPGDNTCIKGTCAGGFNDGNSCMAQADCEDGVNDGVCSFHGGGAGLAKINEGIERIKRLFVKSFSGWSWPDLGTDDYYYSDVLGAANNWDADYQTMLPCLTAATGLPRPDYDSTIPITRGDYCGMPPIIKNILVGGKEGGSGDSVNLGSQGGKVQLSFTIDADPDQLPIIYIEVDWRDDTNPSMFLGKYADGKIVFTHDYRRTGTHEPRILVYDNWDWCGVVEGQVVSAVDHRHNTWVGGNCDWIDTEVYVNLKVPGG